APAVRPHRRHTKAGEAHDAHQVLPYRRFPRPVVEVHDEAERRSAVVIDEDVDAPEAFERLGNDLLVILGAAHVAQYRDDLGTALLAQALGRLSERRIAPRPEDELGTLARERLRDGEADALAGAADDGQLILKPEIHDSPPRPP